MRTALAAIALTVSATLAGMGPAVAEPVDGLDPNRLTCQLWAQGVAPSAIYDRLVQQFGLSSKQAFGLIDSADPAHSAMCSEV